MWDWEPAFSCLFFPIFVQFSFHQYFQEWNFSSKIFQEPFKLECSYLVCRLMMTCCIVGSGTSLLLLTLPCICQIFFPSILWRMTFFIKDFSTTMHTRMLIFCMQIDDDLFYHGIVNHPYPAYSSCICPFFFPSLLWIMRFFNTDFSATMQAGIIIFAILVHSCCTMGLRISLLLLILPCILLISFSPYFE